MKFINLLLVLSLISCSSPDKRTKFSDKNMRIMVDPDSIDVENFVKLQTELVKSNAWTVIDRGAGFKASKKEQERLHRYNSDRFDNREKFAHWGKLYGVGAIVVAHVQCTYGKSFWRGKPQDKCYQALNLVDANTGEVVIGVDGHNAAPIGEVPNWEDMVNKLLAVYPKHFTPKKIEERLYRYKQESKEHSQRQKRRGE